MLREVSRGTRSTLLYDDAERTFHRRYHDTLATSPPLATHWDTNGVERFHNQRVEALIGGRVAIRAPPGEGDETSYAGARVRKVPAHLRNTLSVLVRRPPDVESVASFLNVQVSTAWCYASKVVETWPAAAEVARPLVYPPLCAALKEVDCKGSLKQVMERLERSSSLRGDYEWRCLTNRYAHLRLARLCCCE